MLKQDTGLGKLEKLTPEKRQRQLADLEALLESHTVSMPLNFSVGVVTSMAAQAPKTTEAELVAWMSMWWPHGKPQQFHCTSPRLVDCKLQDSDKIRLAWRCYVCDGLVGFVTQGEAAAELLCSLQDLVLKKAEELTAVAQSEL